VALCNRRGVNEKGLARRNDEVKAEEATEEEEEGGIFQIPHITSQFGGRRGTF
jgi:hypothetical protein